MTKRILLIGPNYDVAREYIMQSTEYGLTSYHRPDYTPEERQQVVDWMNGEDQPLPAINVADYPGLGHAPANYVKTSLLKLYGLTD
jgi:hypothetical protein